MYTHPREHLKKGELVPRVLSIGPGRAMSAPPHANAPTVNQQIRTSLHPSQSPMSKFVGDMSSFASCFPNMGSCGAEAAGYGHTDMTEELTKPTEAQPKHKYSVGDFIKSPVEENDMSGGKDYVAFAAVEWLVYENEPFVKVGVHRTGSGKDTVTFEWSTQNINIIPESYRDQKGTVTLGPGEMTHEITICLWDNDTWNIEATQVVSLSNPSENLSLGELDKTQVIILNDDVFPNGLAVVKGKFVVVKAFITQLTDAFPYETKMTLFLKMWPAFAWLVRSTLLLATMNFAFPKDFVTKDANGEHTDKGTVWMVYMWIGIYLGSIVISEIQVGMLENLRMGGKAKGLLRHSSVLTALQFDNRSQDDFSAGSVLNVMATGIDQAVDSTFLSFFELWQNLVQLVVMIGFTAFIAFDAATHLNKCFVAFPFVYVVLDSIIIKAYAGNQATKYLAFMEEEQNWKASAIALCDLRPLIITYKRGKAKAQEFEDIHKQTNKRYFETSQLQNRTGRIAKALNAIIAMVGFGVAGTLVCEHKMLVGDFVALFSTLLQFDVQVRVLFNVVFNMSNGFAGSCILPSLMPIPRMAASARQHVSHGIGTHSHLCACES